MPLASKHGNYQVIKISESEQKIEKLENNNDSTNVIHLLIYSGVIILLPHDPLDEVHHLVLQLDSDNAQF